MANKTKQQARALMAKTGMSYQAALNQLRKGRASAFPDHVGSSDEQRLFFRPFEAVLVGTHGDRIEVKASLEGGQYVVQTSVGSVEIPAAQVHRDERGPVAVLDLETYQLSDDFVIHVDVEATGPFGDEATVFFNGALMIERTGPYTNGKDVYCRYFQADGTAERLRQP